MISAKLIAEKKRLKILQNEVVGDTPEITRCKLRIMKLYQEKRKERKMADHIFCDGLRVEEKQISQDFKIIKLGIKAEPFMEFLAKYTNEKGYVNIDIKTSKGGKLYAELNTYGMSKTDEPEEDIVSFGEVEDVPF